MVAVSVIIPVYNVEDYLNQCLLSVAEQTFEDFEAICIDDGSTDKSSQILKEFAENDSRFKIITQKNMGVSAARNHGLKEASGDYIYFLDSDDYIEKNALERLYTASKARNTDLIIFKLELFENEYVNSNYSNAPFLPSGVFNYHDFKKDVFRVDVTVYTKFFKKSLISDKRFPEGLIFEDNAFYADYIFDAERIYFLDECLYHKRVHDRSTISRASRNYMDLFEINRIIDLTLQKRGLFDEFADILFCRKIDSIYYRFTLIQPKYKQSYYDLMKKDFSSKKDEYESFKNISFHHKNIFESVMNSEAPADLEMLVKVGRLKNKNKILKKENEELKKLNSEILTSRSWRMTSLFRRIRRFFKL